MVDWDARDLTDVVETLSIASGTVNAAVTDITDESALPAAIDETARAFGPRCRGRLRRHV